jgi:hypothetical protein
MRKLNKKWRSRARDIFVECDGDIEKCKAAFKRRYGSLATFLLILQILLTLWEFWSSKGISEPPMAVADDEPVGWHDDDDEE